MSCYYYELVVLWVGATMSWYYYVMKCYDVFSSHSLEFVDSFVDTLIGDPSSFHSSNWYSQTFIDSLTFTEAFFTEAFFDLIDRLNNSLISSKAPLLRTHCCRYSTLYFRGIIKQFEAINDAFLVFKISGPSPGTALLTLLPSLLNFYCVLRNSSDSPCIFIAFSGPRSLDDVIGPTCR